MRANREVLFLKGLAAAQMHRDKEALAAFEVPALKADAETGLWRGLVQQRLGRNTQALVDFRRGEGHLDLYPPELQAELREAMARAALATQDMGVAERQIQHLADMSGDAVDPERLALLQAMLNDAGGRADMAMQGYRPLFEAKSRPVAAEAQLRAVKLADAEKRSDLKVDEAIARLENRRRDLAGRADRDGVAGGAEPPVHRPGPLARCVSGGASRQRDLLGRSLTRRMHDETAQRFAELFSQGGGDKLPRIEALALSYDFKEFLPVGRRGDEITRLLADRLVELDLLDQAAEI